MEVRSGCSGSLWRHHSAMMHTCVGANNRECFKCPIGNVHVIARHGNTLVRSYIVTLR